MANDDIVASLLAEIATHEKEVLRVLRGTGAATTGWVAQEVSFRHGNNRMHAHYVRSRLIDLENRGLVKRLDYQKPVCWMLTGESNG